MRDFRRGGGRGGLGHSRTRGRVAAAVLAVLAGLTLVGLVGATAAQAHSQLVNSDPAAGSVVSSSPNAIRLTFSEPILDGTAQLRASGPAGLASTGSVVVSGTSFTGALRAGLPDGGYTVLWRVTSGDGHPVSGSFTFTIDALSSGSSSSSAGTRVSASSSTAEPGAAASSPTLAPATTSSTTSTSTSTSSTTSPRAVLLAAPVLALAVALGAARALRRRRARSTG